MLKELYTASLGMLPQQTKLEVIANNLSNANTAGFKREMVFERNLIDARANLHNTPGDAETSDLPLGSYVNFEKGALQKTDNTLDIAIENQNGFFLLKDKDENQFLTKSGHFTISPEGTITATDGKMLIGENGPINLKNHSMFDPARIEDSKSLNIRINEDSDVFVNQDYVGSIAIKRVENLHSLKQVSNANFVINDNTVIEDMAKDEIAIRQGWLESSNVDIIKEMVSMIELQRLFELGRKVISTNDATLGQSIGVGRYY